jgi:hypothetical protein
LACQNILNSALEGEWDSTTEFTDVHVATNETGEWVEVI